MTEHVVSCGGIRIEAYGFLRRVRHVSECVGIGMVGSGENDATTFSCQLEISMNLSVGIQFVSPNHEIAMRWDDGGVACIDSRRFRNLETLRLVEVVADIHACNIHFLRTAVVKLYPVVVLEVFVGVNSIGSTDFIDFHRMEVAVSGVRKWCEASHEVDFTR